MRVEYDITVSPNHLANAIETCCIDFFEWANGLGYQQYDGVGEYISIEESGNKVYSTKQLYEKFLNK